MNENFTLAEAMEAVNEYISEAAVKYYAANDGYDMTDESKENKKVKNLPKDTLNNPKDRQNKTISEAVDERKLSVYEAFDAGLITESEKENMLDLLDLSNYE